MTKGALESRQVWAISAGVVLGLLAGIIVSLASPTSRKAEAQVLISSPQGLSAVTPSLPNLRELAKSGVLAGNVRSTLRLQESIAELSDHMDARVAPQSQVIIISAEDANADRARQIAQEAAVVFAQLVQSRFGQRSPPLQAALTDSAHLLAGPDRHFVRNALIGSFAGLLVGLLAALLLQRSPEAEKGGAEPAGAMRALREREAQLETRVKTVTAREREVAKRAGELAARQRELERRVVEVETPDEEPTKPVEPSGTQDDELVETTEEIAAGVGPAHGSGWNIHELRRLVERQTGSSPEQAEEWRAYLYFLREHATADGVLPASFNGLVVDVFGGLLDERSTAAR